MEETKKIQDRLEEVCALCRQVWVPRHRTHRSRQRRHLL